MTDPLQSPTVDPGASVSPETSVSPGASVSPDAGVSPETPAVQTPSPAAPPPDLRPRPLIERIGMAAIAIVIGALFGVVAVAAFVGGEPFLGAMGAAGALMVLWLGARTLIRG